MAPQPHVARGDLIRKRVAVLGWAVADHVGDEHLAPVEPDAGEELVEELPGGTDERPPLNVLVVAGRLAEEEDAGFAAALPRHGLPGAAVERARRAGLDLGGQRTERVVVHSIGIIAARLGLLRADAMMLAHSVTQPMYRIRPSQTEMDIRLALGMGVFVIAGIVTGASFLYGVLRAVSPAATIVAAGGAAASVAGLAYVWTTWRERRFLRPELHAVGAGFVTLGGDLEVEWERHGDPHRPVHLAIDWVGREGMCKVGYNDVWHSSEFARRSLYEGSEARGRVRVAVEPDEMHSFDDGRCEIVWQIEVRASRTPDARWWSRNISTFPLEVVPPR